MITFDRWLEDFMTENMDLERKSPGGVQEEDKDDGEDVLDEQFPEFVAILFENAHRYLDRYPEDRVADGLHCLLDAGCSDAMLIVRDAPGSPEVRQRAIRSFSTLFSTYMTDKCSQTLSHLNEPGARPLNGVCYIWWDTAPFPRVPFGPIGNWVDRECLRVMKEQLEVPHVAVQESALHGLGHWKTWYPEEATEMIDEFLGRNPRLRKELLEYAMAAREGCIL